MIRNIFIALVTLSLAGPALAMDRVQLDDRIRLLTGKFEAMQQQVGKNIPPDTLSKAQGIILLDRTKAGFVFAYEGGNGVAMVKDAEGHWSPAAFLSATEASIGFQIGAEQNFFVILLMNTNAARQLAEPTINLGGEARGTAGDQSSGVEGNITSPEQSVLVYGDRNGLYGGAAIKGGAISPDNDGNEIYYDKFVTMNDILFDEKVEPTQSEIDLAQIISKYSRK